MEDMDEQRKLADEVMVIHNLIDENPCGMKDGLISALREVVHTFVGRYCIDNASREQVARYLQRDVRTITRWEKEYDDFPKGQRDFHSEVRFNWIDIAKWKIKHQEIYEGQ